MNGVFAQSFDFDGEMSVIMGKTFGIFNDQFDNMMFVNGFQRIVSGFGNGFKLIIELFFFHGVVYDQVTDKLTK
ncbi:MAG: hypothetical protein JRF17_11195 [Deltaproteobacteria bacterium]|nr:hypothetical protein [Deltaproteobacteria bacterium]